MDIGETLEVKLESIHCYKTQFPAAKAHVFDRVRSAAEFTGASAGFKAGEMFVTTRALGTSDLVDSLF